MAQSQGPATVVEPKKEQPVVGFNFLHLGESPTQTSTSHGSTLTLPSTAVDFDQARRAHEEFVSERLVAAESALRGARSNLASTQKEEETNKVSIMPSSWFLGGLRQELKKQELAEAAFVQESEKKVQEFKKRESLSQQLLLASQQLSQQAQQYERAGDAVRAAGIRTMANQVLELTPAVLEAPTGTFNSLAPKVERVLASVTSDPSGVGVARESMALAKGAVSQWQGSIDTSTGQRPRTSAIASTKDLQKAYQDVNANIQKSFVMANRTEYVVITGVVIAVGAVAATVASGGLALPAFLGGATIGTGYFGGAALGIAAGTLVGATAAYSEALGNTMYGKRWDEVSRKALADTESYFFTALGSVGFAKVAQTMGFALGKMGAFGRWATSPFASTAGKLPKWGKSLFTPIGRGVSGAIPASVTSGVLTVGDGMYTQMKSIKQFQDWAREQPKLNPEKSDFDGDAYYKAWSTFQEANHITNEDVLWQAGQNMLVSGAAAVFHSGAPANSRFQGLLRHAKGVGVGVATEVAVDKFRESTNHVPLGKPMDVLRPDVVDEADAMRISWAELWGTVFRRGLDRGFNGPRK